MARRRPKPLRDVCHVSIWTLAYPNLFRVRVILPDELVWLTFNANSKTVEGENPLSDDWQETVESAIQELLT